MLQALQVLEGMAAWTDWRTGRLPEEQMQRTLQTEFGGMNEVLANLSAVTGNPRYLVVAKRFDHHVVMDPAAQGRDTLTGLHANTQIPKFIGAAREYELTGEPHYRDAALFFWQQVALHRSYVTGGNSVSEHFRTPPDVLASALTDLTQETCNTYNMLKLTSQLFTLAGRAAIRRLLRTRFPEPHSRHAAIRRKARRFTTSECNPASGKFTSCRTRDSSVVAARAWKISRSSARAFIFTMRESLWVNLFFASEVNWREKGVVIRQETRFPEEAEHSPGHSDEIARANLV